jgi:hypothetical protein
MGPMWTLKVSSIWKYISKILQCFINDQTLQYQTFSDVCTIFVGSVWCKQRFTASSDERIKTTFKILMMIQHYRSYY